MRRGKIAIFNTFKSKYIFFTLDKRESHFHPERKHIYRFVEPERTDPIDPGQKYIIVVFKPIDFFHLKNAIGCFTDEFQGGTLLFNGVAYFSGTVSFCY